MLVGVFALIGGVMAAGAFTDAAWNRRAANICSQESEKPAGASSASGYSIRWDWTELAYVCRYHGPSEPKRRVGLTEAFF